MVTENVSCFQMILIFIGVSKPPYFFKPLFWAVKSCSPLRIVPPSRVDFTSQSPVDSGCFLSSVFTDVVNSEFTNCCFKVFFYLWRTLLSWTVAR